MSRLSRSEKEKLRMWLSEPLPADVAASLERLAAADDVRHVAVMPDVHLAHEVCVGAVVGASRLLYPAAVGGDIGCGMAAVRCEADADLLAGEKAAARVLAGLYARVPSNRRRADDACAALPDGLDSLPLSDPRLEKLKRREGRVQLGTLGRGNHFLELQRDSEDRLWLMVHSGSRAMGQAITAHHLALAEAAPNGLACLDADSDRGRAYLADVAWAIRYAEQNRLAIVSSVAELLRELFDVQTDWASLIHAHHNHVQREVHFGESLWVHRKGAQSARAGEAGIIPGSMGAASFHVTGRGCVASLCSASHGAGRRLSRSEARRKVSAKQLQRQLGSVWFDHRMEDALRDEAPAAYKDIHAVMRAQRELIRIDRELQPVLNYKG